jgi:CDP-diacylglycerol--serine O-phosphatidyltransferase
VSFIFLALIADGLDGIIARRFGGGKMGESLEAMADMVSLSLAPLCFVFVYAIELKIDNILISLPTILVGLLFICFSAIRLASFHVLKDKHYFVGLPASVSTILLIGLSYFDLPLYSYLVIFLILSILMISSIKFPKPTKTMNFTATILILLGILLYTYYHSISFILLVGAMILYSILGPFYIKKFYSNAS